MAQAVEPERGASSVTFEVERFEAQGRDRMVLSGRWFGLRGRRFVRPALTLGADGHRQRALADLEDKPWAARDGELWKATFPYDRAGDDLSRIELTVAPDITVTLPVPGSGAAEQRIRARPRRDDLLDNLRGARRDGRPRAGSGIAADRGRTDRSATRWEDGSESHRIPQTPSPVGADGSDRVGARRSGGAAARGFNGAAAPQSDRSPDLARRLSQAQQETEMLKTELARYEGARQARAQAVRARDQALRERDRMAAERDRALHERDRAIAKAKKLSEAAAGHRNGAIAPTVTRSRAVTSQGIMWAQRILAVSVLVIAVLAFAITARVI